MLRSIIAQTIGELTFPVPASNIAIFWTLLGAQFGRSFGKKLDQGIQAGFWFESLSPTRKGIVKRILDFFHHWWIGGILWLYAPSIAAIFGVNGSIEIMFFGYGLMLDDLRDIENLKRRYNGTEPT